MSRQRAITLDDGDWAVIEYVLTNAKGTATGSVGNDIRGALMRLRRQRHEHFAHPAPATAPAGVTAEEREALQDGVDGLTLWIDGLRDNGTAGDIEDAVDLEASRSLLRRLAERPDAAAGEGM